MQKHGQKRKKRERERETREGEKVKREPSYSNGQLPTLRSF